MKEDRGKKSKSVPLRETRTEPGRSIRGRNISRATPDQAETLTQIAFAAKRHWGYPDTWVQLWSPSLTITPDFIEQHETFVAWVDAEPAGFCAISREGENASVEHLWIKPDYIGKGVGSSLFHHMLSRCKELGVQILKIESDPNAQGFYERMGAKKVGEVVGEVDGKPRKLPLLEVKI
jgi:GNAT superfamily N-acetyltransferase